MYPLVYQTYLVQQFELLDEISDQLQIETAPMMWPAGMGLNFKGVLDFASDAFIPFNDGKLDADLKAKLDEDVMLAREGLTSLYSLDATAVMGLREVVPAIPKILRRVRNVVDFACRTRPDVVVVIDSPDFTHRVAQGIRKRDPSIRTVDYVAPQVWASRAYRAKKMATYFDLVLALFPFEVPFFEKYGLKAAFVGPEVPATQVPNIPQEVYLMKATTRIVLPHFKEAGKPFALLFWSRDPDVSQHNTNDSLGETVPGIKGATAAAQVKPATMETGLVVIVPGYGMAVAQAQHAVRELAELIEHRGGRVRFAIHPVAGRMPGHMNVLLAEANVPYDHLFDLDEINSEFAACDVALVLGANDVTNPAAKSDPGSPIYGMPILNVADAEQVIVVKRGMATGFAGIENELFYLDKTSMLFGDAKSVLAQVVTEVKAL